jgi:hypothetical protein
MHSPKAKTKKESCHGCHVARMIPSDALEESGKGGVGGGGGTATANDRGLMATAELCAFKFYGGFTRQPKAPIRRQAVGRRRRQHTPGQRAHALIS